MRKSKSNIAAKEQKLNMLYGAGEDTSTGNISNGDNESGSESNGEGNTSTGENYVDVPSTGYDVSTGEDVSTGDVSTDDNASGSGSNGEGNESSGSGDGGSGLTPGRPEDSEPYTLSRTIPDIIDKYIKREVSGKLIYVNQIAKITNVELVSTNMRKYISSNIDITEQIIEEGYTYIIQHQFDLNPDDEPQLPTFEIPYGVTLEFTGDGMLKNCVLKGNGATIKASKRIFKNVQVTGIWNCPGNVEWFTEGTKIIKHEQWGYVFPSMTDISDELQLALDSAFRELHFPPKYYYITKPLTLTKEKRIFMRGGDMQQSIMQRNTGRENNSVIFSDQNITLLKISVNEMHQNTVFIDGGNFDVSMCNNYTSSCVQILADHEGERMWGVTINTNIKGKENQMTGIGLDINPNNVPSMAGNKAYVTKVRINANISNFGTGARIMDHIQGTVWYNWCTDVNLDGCIVNCATAVETNADIDIRAMIQAGKLFNTKNNGRALIVYSGLRGTISSNIYDIQAGDDSEGYSNQYALKSTRPRSEATVSTYGHFRTFWMACEKAGFPSIIDGEIEPYYNPNNYNPGN